MTKRKDYMDGKITHDDYYRALAKESKVSYADAEPAFLERVRKALADGDEHLNSIPLSIWDARAASLMPSVMAAFKAAGDHYSMAGGVCLIKRAAKDAVTP